MRRYYRWGLAAVGIIGLLAVGLWLVTRPYSEIREEFGITLPIIAKLCDSVGGIRPVQTVKVPAAWSGYSS